MGEGAFYALHDICHRCYTRGIWSVEGTDEFAAWYATLAPEQHDALAARIELLEQHGPNLKRPTVGEILSSRHAPHMKELRVSAEGHLRVLFAIDPRRTVILLLGGNKTGRWDEWYRVAIPVADRLYDLYLEELRSEGAI